MVCPVQISNRRESTMSMFDKETQLKNAAEFDAAQPFALFSGEYLGMVESAEYGARPKARVKAGPAGSIESAGQEYIVFGVLAEQINRMQPDDLPATVKLAEDGRAKVFVKVE
jgi:hypothetical protein